MYTNVKWTGGATNVECIAMTTLEFVYDICLRTNITRYFTMFECAFCSIFPGSECIPQGAARVCDDDIDLHLAEDVLNPSVEGITDVGYS